MYGCDILILFNGAFLLYVVTFCLIVSFFLYKFALEYKYMSFCRHSVCIYSTVLQLFTIIRVVLQIV